MILEMQLLLPVNLGSVNRPFPDNFKSIILQRERSVYVSKFTQRSECATLHAVRPNSNNSDSTDLS